MSRVIQDEFTGKGTSSQRHYLRNPEKRREQALRHYHKQKEIHGEEKVLEIKRQKAAKYVTDDPIKAMLSSTRNGAKKRGLEFNLDRSDIIIPEVCPVFDIPLFRGKGRLVDNSPTIDRFDSTKGYIKGNIDVISWKANRAKSDSTVEDLEKVLVYMKKKLTDMRGLKIA